MLCSLIFLLVVTSPILLSLAHAGESHEDHLNDPTDDFHNDYAPMFIPINDKSVAIAPVITCTTFEDGIWKPNHNQCKLAKTLLVDDDWGNEDARYTYLFEDWTDYDWNDLVVSLYAITSDIITVEFCIEDREACWKNPFSVEITSETLTVDVHWISTDYPADHNVRLDQNETMNIELFAESNEGDTAFIHLRARAPPSPVGGHATPIDMPHLLLPKIGLVPEKDLALVLLASVALAIILIRRRCKTLRQQH